MFGLQPRVDELLHRFLVQASDAGIPLRVVEGVRSPERQAAVLAAGTSNAPPGWSYHQYGLAFDVVPLEYLALPNWNPTGPFWGQLGDLGERLGLVWGGRFAPSAALPDGDKPHFEYHPGFSILDLMQAVQTAGMTALEAGRTLLESPKISGSILGGLIVGGVVLWILMRRGP